MAGYDVEYELREPILLDYTDEDLGMSGIVLKSPLEYFDRYKKLNDMFHYGGTLLENPDWCFINEILSDGSVLRIHKMLKCYIKKHPEFEKVSDEWMPVMGKL